MDSELRSKMLGVNQPPKIGTAEFPANDLMDNLDQKYKTWIKDIYAPAYVAYMMAMNPPSQYSDDAKFSDSEKSKIMNWWQGNVSSWDRLFKRHHYTERVPLRSRSFTGKEYALPKRRVSGSDKTHCTPGSHPTTP